MVWLTIETFILLLLWTGLGIGIGAVMRKLVAGGGSSSLAYAGAGEATPSTLPEGAEFAPLEPETEQGMIDAAAERETPVSTPVEPTAEEGVIDPSRAAAADQVGFRPAMLAGARDGTPDDLKRIKGIGPQNESRLNALGIFHFDQIASWTPEEARWVGSYLAFPGRIEREGWIDQARGLAIKPT